jgi:hypothetical protein
MLWQRFCQAFIREVAAVPVADLDVLWSNEKKRTRFYLRHLLPAISDGLGLGWKCEVFHRADFVIFDAGERGVPLIMIESENKPFSAATEVRQLCLLSAPLKVLLTVTEWDDEPGGWQHGGYRRELLDEWASVIRAFSKVWPRTGVLAILVGERRLDRLRFYATVFDSTGQISEPGRVVVERDLAVGAGAQYQDRSVSKRPRA